MYGEQNGFVSDKDRPEYNPNFNFDKYIMNQGIKFENNLIQLIKQKFQSKFVEIKGYDPQQKYKKTIDALKKGIPIIYQGIVRNSSNKTFGYPDIIIRSDYINSLVCVPVLSDSEIIIPCNFHSNFHYLIVDIKFKMLGLTADGIHILKDQSSHVYKSQLLIYNQALGLMQGYTSNFAFILGRGNKIKGEVTPNCFDRLGKINFNDRDSIYFDINNNAISWIKDVKKNGHTWKIIDNDKPSRIELCPNMSNRRDTPWHYIKKEIADKTKEITLLLNCTPNQRLNAYSKGYYTWDTVNSDVLELKGNTAEIVDEIIKMNKGNYSTVVHPEIILNNDKNWQNLTDNLIEFYVDFETVNGLNDTFENLPESKCENIIYMIGCGYICPESLEWKFMSFVVEHLSKKNEMKIILEWTNKMNELSQKYNQKLSETRIFHWSNAELNFIKNLSFPLKNHLNWIDMYKIFKTEPIVIKGCMSYKLKEVAKAMKKFDLIETTWTGSCVDGIGAMVAAWNCEKLAKETGSKMWNGDLGNGILNEVNLYNEIDCKVIYEVVDYFRNLKN